MKKSILTSLLGVCAFFSAHATFTTVAVTGYTADVIANGSGTASTSTNNDVDGGGYAFMASSYNPSGTIFPTQFLPSTGLLNSVATSGLSFQLASYSSNNDLRLSATTSSGTLTVTTPVSAGEVYILGTSGSGSSVADITVTFTDATTQVFTGISFNDWYNGTPYVVLGLGRVSIATDNIDNNATNPRLYQAKLTLNAANYVKQIASISFTRTSASGAGSILNIMGVSINDVCSGTPVGGAAAAAPTSACVTTSLTLSLSGASSSSGIAYQWQDSSSTTGNAWVNISGATDASYTYTGQAVATKYRCSLTCTPSALATVYSAPVSVSEYTCYCTPSFPSGCYVGPNYLSNVTIGTINNTVTGCSQSDFTSMSTTVTAGTSVAMSITAQGYAGIGVYADWNQDGDFNDVDEFLYGAYPGNSTPTVTPNISIPGYVLPGSYRLRVIAPWATNPTAGQACNTFQYGSFQDYTLNVLNNSSCFPPAGAATSAVLATSASFTWGAPSTTTPQGYRWIVVPGGQPVTATPIASGSTSATTFTATANGLTSSTAYTFYIRSGCSSSSTDSSVWIPVNFTTICGGTPNGGTAQASVSGICPNTGFNLSVSGNTAGPGITYQWESSTNSGGTWTSISGATNATYAVTSQSQNTQYRIEVTCGSGTPVPSAAATVNMNPSTQCYCIPTYTNGGVNDIITNVQLGTLNNNTAAAGNPTSHYTDFSLQQPGTLPIPSVSQGQTATLTLTFGSDGSQYNGVWIDFNQDGTLSSSEYFTSGTNAGSNGTANVSLVIPATALTGITRMRIRGADDNQPSPTQACGASSSTYGEAEDYSIRIRPQAPTLTASANPACVGSNVTLTATSTATSPTIIWTGPGSYTATGASVTINNITATQAGTYTAKVIIGTDTSDAGTIALSVTTPPTGVTAASNSPVCAGTALNLTGGSTTTGVTYSWTGPNSYTASTQNPTIAAVTAAAAGTYTVTASLGGCSATATTTVTVNPAPAGVTANNNGPICEGATLLLTGNTTSSGATYGWTGPNSFTANAANASVANATTAATGTYTLTVTANGCSATATTSATVNTAPTGVAASSNGPVCEGSPLSLNVSNTTTGATYSWSGPNSFTANTQSPAIASPTTAASGTYTATVSVGGCSVTANTTVTVNATPVISNVTGTNPTACFGTNGSITITGLTPSTAYTLNYTKNGVPAAPVSFTSTAAGSYTLTGLGIGVYNGITVKFPSTGCISAAAGPVTLANPITVPTPVVTNNGPLCEGNTLNLTATSTTGSTYTWTGPGGYTSTTQNPSLTNISTLQAGNYAVVAHYQGCLSAAGNTTVTVNPLPAATVTPLGSTTICSDATLVLQANTGTGLTYQWISGSTTIPGANGSTYSANTSSSYSVRVTSGAGCSKTSNPVAVTVIAAPASTISYNTPTSFCDGGSVDLLAAPGINITYQWLKDATPISGATNSNYVATTGGTYTLLETNATGCDSLSAGVVVTVFTVQVPIISQNGNTLSTSGFSAYQWYESSTAIPGATNASYTITHDGYYQVAGTDANGCNAMSAQAWIQHLGVKNVTLAAKDINIYPNPANSIVHIDAPVPVNVTVQNLQGQTVMQQNAINEINISSIADGIYMVQVKDKDGNLIKTERLSKMSK
ncbi:GEVED domain-containing protein [Chitinophagaceae bacterium MMS25-I14]